MESFGGPLTRYFEDFSVGKVYRFPIGRTVTESDNSWFTLLTMNTNQVHFNADFAARTEFGRPLVNSGLSIALVLGMSVTDLSAQATANLGFEDIRLVHPLFVGDTVYVESLVTAVRESKSREGTGIVSVLTRGLNQDGIEFLRFHRAFLVPRRARRIDSFPRARTALTDSEGRTHD